jgi:hypothetical protein
LPVATDYSVAPYDPKAPNRGYLVVRREAGVIGVAVNTQASGAPRRGTGLCDLCNL